MGSLPFVLRKHMNLLLKGVFVLNLGLLLIGMGLITWLQNDGAFYANEITVSFGEQIWSDAQVMTPSGEVESRNLLFSYFNGVYRRDRTSSGGTPIYVEQNKYDGSPYEITKGAEIRYCKKEKVWAFTHVNIRKNRNSVDLECPWLLRSPETTEFNLLDVTGDWSIWTGSIQPDGHFSTADNQCHNEVDCNYNGMCEDGECVCSDDGLGGQYFGTHCEHRKACNLISGGEGGTWAEVSLGDVETRVYQRPIYEPHQGLPSHLLHLKGVNPVEDSIRIIYTGSRWLGAAYPGAKLENQTSDDARLYMKEFHAFWENMYADRTHFVSEATTKSSIIGVDFYLLGRQGEEFGTFGELIPLGNNHKGSGHYKCVENDPPPPGPAYDINFRGVTASSNEDSTDIVVDYEVAREREYESEILARNCVNPITGIDLNLTTVKSPKNSTHDSLILKYNLDKLQLTNSNIWNATNEKIELCQLVRLIFPAANSIPKMVVIEEKQRIRVDVEEDSLF